IIKSLLSGHGAMLVIADDIWHKSVIEPIQRAIPNESTLLITTRDSRIAVEIGRKIELDILSPPDASKIILRTLPEMPVNLQTKLAQAVGYHPLALDVAVSDLAARGKNEWEECINEINRLISEGESLNALPLVDESNRESLVEKVILYSYNALKHIPEGNEYQKRYRALGCFPREANFDTVAVRGIWRDDNDETTRSFLNVFVARSLLQRKVTDRWQLHSVLRAFAIKQQSVDEKLKLSEIFAEHYINRM